MTGSVSIPIQISFSQLLEAIDQLSTYEQHQLLVHILNHHEKNNLIVTHFATEAVLSKNWDTNEEDVAWQDL